MTPEIIGRLQDRVPALHKRVYGAAALALLMSRANPVPNVTPCAHVLPTGIGGQRNSQVSAGAYLQAIDRGFSVVLSLRSHDPMGANALDELDVLIDAIIAALAGWTPARTPGVMTFRDARLAAFENGVAIYDIRFELLDQLRLPA